MKKNVFFALLVIVLVLVACTQLFTIKAMSKPHDSCITPYDWAACGDWAFKGLHLTWGAENNTGFISIVNMEDWHMLWNGSGYNRSVRKTYMIQSSFLGDSQYGDCNGWGGICYKYSEYSEMVKP